MLPLSEQVIVLLALIAVSGAAAIGIALSKSFGVGRTVLFLAVALLWPWPIAAALGLDGYTMRYAMMYGLWTAGFVVVGMIWAQLARRLARGSAGVLLMLVAVPSLGAAAYVLEDQRIPEAPCADRALFAIGDLTVAVPREVGARSMVAADGPDQVWQGEYGAWVGAKQEVRDLCRATDGGRESLRVVQLSIPVAKIRRQLASDCAAGTGTAAVCAALERTELTILQMHDMPDGRPGLTLGLFDAGSIATAITSGETRGIACSTGPAAPDERYCTIWQAGLSGTLVLMAARLGPEQAGEDPAGDAAILLAAVLDALRAASDTERLR
ncbi:MAG: hypothetical protein WBA67_00120 [Jannaschia sp.]